MKTIDYSQIHSEIVHQISKGDDIGELSRYIENHLNKKYPLLSGREKDEIIRNVSYEIDGYGFIQSLLDDNTVNEIMINSPTCCFIEKDGVYQTIEINVTNEQLIRLIQKIAAEVKTQCDVAHPILDAWLDDGSRVHAVLPPIAPDGPYLTIRRFVKKSYDVDLFCSNNSYRQVIEDVISKKKNIVIAGGTSTGKTTLLNCLIDLVSQQDRVISIEETAELSAAHSHWVRLIARSANGEGSGNVSLSELVKATLRMRPDRIVVGEVRSAEAFDLIQALNTGHNGSLCTIHANGPQEVVHRLGSLALFAHPGLDYRAIKAQIAYGIDVVIFVSRINNKQRQISSICNLETDGDQIILKDLMTKEQYYV